MKNGSIEKPGTKVNVLGRTKLRTADTFFTLPDSKHRENVLTLLDLWHAKPSRVAGQRIVFFFFLFPRLFPAAYDVRAFKLLRPHRQPTRPSAPGEVQDPFQAGPGSRSRLRLGWPRASEGRARDGLLDCDGDDALPSPGPAARSRCANSWRRALRAEMDEIPQEAERLCVPSPANLCSQHDQALWPATCEFGVSRLLAALRDL